MTRISVSGRGELRGLPARRRARPARGADVGSVAPSDRRAGADRVGAQDLRRARHGRARAQARRRGAARERGAVPRDLQRLGRRDGAVELEPAARRRQLGLRAAVRLEARGGDRPRLRHARRAGAVQRAAARPGAPFARRRDLPRRARVGAQERRALPGRHPHHPVHAPRRAACAHRGARHHRAPRARAGDARERGAVPRHLQRDRRCPGAVGLEPAPGRRQQRLRAAVRLEPRRGGRTARLRVARCDPGLRRAAPGARAPLARRGDLPRRARVGAQERRAFSRRCAHDSLHASRGAARADDRARHHRAARARGGAAGERGAVSRDLQRLLRRHDHPHAGGRDRRRQSRARVDVRLRARGARRQDLRADHLRKAAPSPSAATLPRWRPGGTSAPRATCRARTDRGSTSRFSARR